MCIPMVIYVSIILLYEILLPFVSIESKRLLDGKQLFLQKKRKISKITLKSKPIPFNTRYETKCFQRNLSPNMQTVVLPTEDFSELSLNTSGITKSVSTNVASSTSIKRMTGRQTVTTSINSIDRKN